MVFVYDEEYGKVPIVNCENHYVIRKKDGNDKMSFCVNPELKEYAYLKEEAIVEDDENSWVIKKIDDDKVDCELNLDEFKKRVYRKYKVEGKTLTDVINAVLPKDWTCTGSNQVSLLMFFELEKCTDFDIIYSCQKYYNVYISWNVLEKEITVYELSKIPSMGKYITKELNLRSLSFKGDTTKFATRIYAYGKDNLTLENAQVENKAYGKTYIDDNSYSSKVISAIYENTEIKDATVLYNEAKAALAKISQPIRSYECDVIDLAKLNKTYQFLDFNIHDKVTLFDDTSNISIEHHVVEYVKYFDEPQRNKITLAEVPGTISNTISNRVSSSTSKISESITGDLSGFNAAIQNLNNSVADLNNKHSELSFATTSRDSSTENLDYVTNQRIVYLKSEDVTTGKNFPVNNEDGFLEVMPNASETVVLQKFTTENGMYFRKGEILGVSATFSKWNKISVVKI